MGLDMYLSRETYFPRDQRQGLVIQGPKTEHIITSRVTNIEEEVGYWRKANAIHKWFVDNCNQGNDECHKAWVDSEKLQELLDLCKQVKADHNLAPQELPTHPGFFFGSYAYDDWYFQDIDETITILEEVIKTHPKDESLWIDYYYRASW